MPKNTNAEIRAKVTELIDALIKSKADKIGKDGGYFFALGYVEGILATVLTDRPDALQLLNHHLSYYKPLPVTQVSK